MNFQLVQQCDLPQPVEEEIISEGDSEYDSEQTVRVYKLHFIASSLLIILFIFSFIL